MQGYDLCSSTTIPDLCVNNTLDAQIRSGREGDVGNVMGPRLGKGTPLGVGESGDRVESKTVVVGGETESHKKLASCDAWSVL